MTEQEITAALTVPDGYRVHAHRCDNRGSMRIVLEEGENTLHYQSLVVAEHTDPAMMVMCQGAADRLVAYARRGDDDPT